MWSGWVAHPWLILDLPPAPPQRARGTISSRPIYGLAFKRKLSSLGFSATVVSMIPSECAPIYLQDVCRLVWGQDPQSALTLNPRTCLHDVQGLFDGGALHLPWWCLQWQVLCSDLDPHLLPCSSFGNPDGSGWLPDPLFEPMGALLLAQQLAQCNVIHESNDATVVTTQGYPESLMQF